MSLDKTFIGYKLEDLEIKGAFLPYSKVVLTLDSETAYTAGDDTGRTLTAACPWATQQMANDILDKIQGFVYSPFEGSQAILDPATELGDGCTAGGVYAPLSKIQTTLDALCAADIGATADEELDHEYPYKSQIQQQIEYQIKQVSASLNVGLDEISATVSGLSDDFTELKVTLDGVTVTDASGTTLIKGSSIQTSTLFVDAANITGTLTANQINLSGSISFGDLDDNVQNEINSANTTASQALDLAQQNELPNYIKSTYIDSARIESPTIYAGEFYGNNFSVYPESNGDGSFNLYGYYLNSLYQFLEISYDGGSTVTDFPRVTFDSPGGANAYWRFSSSFFYGNIDFSGANVTGLSLSSQPDTQTRLAAAPPVLLSAEKGALKIEVEGATWILNSDGLTKEAL